MRQRESGFLQGYRDEVTGASLDWLGTSKRWNKGYEEGRESARVDLEWRYMWSRRDAGHACKSCGLYPDGTDSAPPTQSGGQG
jgi:hypothetical protein